MGTFSIWHWIIVLAVVLLLFGGRGKISQIMGDFGKGLKSFKRSMREDRSFEDPNALPAPKVLPGRSPRASGSGARTKRAARPAALPRKLTEGALVRCSTSVGRSCS